MTQPAVQRLAIGTVQFGLPYGIANTQGQVDRDMAAAILDAARAAGADTLDTAADYGTSEAVLGEIGIDGWRVVSKVGAVPAGTDNVNDWLLTSVRATLTRLRQARLHGLLLHRPDELLGAHGDALHEALQAVKQAGLADKVGISVYDPSELDAITARHGMPDILQAPLNIIDRRLASSGWLARLHAADVEVHTRSAFLQGLLLMPATARPASFDRWNTLWQQWDAWLDTAGTDAVSACLHYPLSEAGVARVVVGVDSLTQLRQIMTAVTTPAPKPPASLSSDDADLINPSRWEAA